MKSVNQEFNESINKDSIESYNNILKDSLEHHSKRVEQHKTVLSIRLKLQHNDLVSGHRYNGMIKESKKNVERHTVIRDWLVRVLE